MLTLRLCEHRQVSVSRGAYTSFLMLLVHPNPSRQEVNLQVDNLYDVLILSYLSFFCWLWCVVSGCQDSRLVGERGPILAGRDKISTDMEGHHLSPDKRYVANSARHLP